MVCLCAVIANNASIDNLLVNDKQRLGCHEHVFQYSHFLSQSIELDIHQSVIDERIDVRPSPQSVDPFIRVYSFSPSRIETDG